MKQNNDHVVEKTIEEANNKMCAAIDFETKFFAGKALCPLEGEKLESHLTVSNPSNSDDISFKDIIR